MKKAITFILSILISLFAFGQATNWEDVIYLKDGGIVRGTIIEQIPNKSFKIQTKDRNVLVYNIDLIEKITKEEISPEISNKTIKPNNNKLNTCKIKGFSNITEIGCVLGIGKMSKELFPENKSQLVNEEKNFSLTTINGYQFNSHFFLGFGIGTEIGKYVFNIPIFLDFRYYLLNNKVSPFAGCGIGYAPQWLYMSSNSYTGFGNAGFSYAQIGLRVCISEDLSWNLGIGYKLQLAEKYYYYWGPNYKLNLYSHFLTLKTGFTF